MKLYCFNRNNNKYSQDFIIDFWDNLVEHFDTSQINLRDREFINASIAKYYSMFFHIFHNKNTRLLHYPEYAFEYNTILTNVLIATIDFVFLAKQNPPISEEKKREIFPILLRKILYRLYKKEKNEISQMETISEILDEMVVEVLNNKILKQYKTQKYPPLSKLTMHFSVKAFYSDKIKKNIKKLKHSLRKYDLPLKSCRNLSFLMICTIASIGLYFDKIETMFFSVGFYFVVIALMLYAISRIEHVKREIAKISDFYSLYGKYNNIGVDILAFKISPNLVSYADPHQDNNLLPVLANLRLNMTENKGFVFPSIRILDDEDVKNGMKIYIRGIEVCYLKFYENRFVILDEICHENNIILPKDIIEDVYDGKKYYWVSEEFCKDLNVDFYLKRDDFIQIVLEDLLFKYIDKVFTIEETFALISLYDSEIPFPDTLDVYLIHDIFVSILKRGGSLKDIIYVINMIIKLLKETKNVEYIAFRICQDLIK